MSAPRSGAAIVAAILACTAGFTVFVVPTIPLGRRSAPPANAELDLDALPMAARASLPGTSPMQGLGLAMGIIGAAFLLARRTPARSMKPAAAIALQSSFSAEIGATLPLKYWDPLGLSADNDTETFRRRRIAEIKNGRVAMWACMGFIVPEYFRWPGYCSPSNDLKFSDIPNGLAALGKVPAAGWAQIGIFIAFLELFPLRQEKDRIPGDAPGCSKLGLPVFFVAGRPGTKCDAKGSERSLNAEINNGRLAMIAITGMVAQNGFLGTTGPEMWIPASASAFEGELGSTAPFKNWDPFGMMADGDKEVFRRRRIAEIKNGRVAMWACLGYIVPEYYRWPGYCSPSNDLKFADIPNGLAALKVVPAAGWAQIGFFIAFLELFPLRQEDDRIPGDTHGAGIFGIPWFFLTKRPSPKVDPVKGERNLNAEINHGRLAMMAITGMVAQNGFIGTTGPEMWIPA